MSIQYTVSETPLKLREYGRNIQSMVEYARTLDDDKQRHRLVGEIVRIMGNINPHLRDNPDYKQKIWEHLYFLSEYDLDVDAPYPMLTEEERAKKNAHPERMPYTYGTPRLKQYGKNVEMMIRKASNAKSPAQEKVYIRFATNIMRQILKSQDRENNIEEIMAEHILVLSEGKLKVKASDLTPPKKSSSRSHKNHHSNNHHRGKSKRRVYKRNHR